LWVKKVQILENVLKGFFGFLPLFHENNGRDSKLVFSFDL